ncbi:unnamed protein product [Cunninghamella blakesleeana]
MKDDNKKDEPTSLSTFLPSLKNRRKSSPAILGLLNEEENETKLAVHLSQHRNSIEAAMLLANFNRPQIKSTPKKETSTSSWNNKNNNNNQSINLKVDKKMWEDAVLAARQHHRRYSYDQKMTWKTMPTKFIQQASLLNELKRKPIQLPPPSSTASSVLSSPRHKWYHEDHSHPHSFYSSSSYTFPPTTQQHPYSSSYPILYPPIHPNNNNNNNNNEHTSSSSSTPSNHSFLSMSTSSSTTTTSSLSSNHHPYTSSHPYANYYYPNKLPLLNTSSSNEMNHCNNNNNHHHHHNNSHNNSHNNNNNNNNNDPSMMHSHTSSSPTSPLPPMNAHPSSNYVLPPPPGHPLHLQPSSSYSHPLNQHHPSPLHPQQQQHYASYPPHPYHPSSTTSSPSSSHQPHILHHQASTMNPVKPKRKRRDHGELEENFGCVMPGDADFPDMSERDVEAARHDVDARPRRQKLRYIGDMYTPQWVRYNGQAKEGLCDTCKPGKWLQLKNSAFWYHKQFFHGISSVSGKEFMQPLDTRWVDQDIVEGLCHQCQQWVSVSNVKRKNSVLWYRHAHKCHVYHKPKSGSPKRR